jgi:hypothetical protein
MGCWPRSADYDGGLITKARQEGQLEYCRGFTRWDPMILRKRRC